MARRVILDCDTGTDDAIAIMLAAARPELDLMAVTAVWGNHAVEHTADNSRRMLDLIGRADVPVHAGRNGPIAAPPGVPRREGSPEPDTLPIPPATTPLEPQDAVEWLVETARAATERFTLVPTGALSNVAAAVAADPAFVEAVEEIVMMGGVMERGGLLPDVETNVGYDPEAAQPCWMPASNGWSSCHWTPPIERPSPQSSAPPCGRTGALPPVSRPTSSSNASSDTAGCRRWRVESGHPCTTR